MVTFIINELQNLMKLIKKNVSDLKNCDFFDTKFLLL